MLKGKKAIITGASRGIGKAIALKFAENGADVALIYAGREDAARQTAKECRKFGIKAEIYKCDVSDFSQAKETVAAAIKDFEGLDILVNNAGITIDKLVMMMSEEDFDRVIEVNLKGAFNMIKHSYMHFAKQRSGRIINISSVSGLAGKRLARRTNALRQGRPRRPYQIHCQGACRKGGHLQLHSPRLYTDRHDGCDARKHKGAGDRKHPPKEDGKPRGYCGCRAVFSLRPCGLRYRRSDKGGRRAVHLAFFAKAI